MLQQLKNVLKPFSVKTPFDFSGFDNVLLRYSMSNFRFHNDVRLPSKSIVVHDYLSSSSAYQQVLHHDTTRETLTPMFLHPLEIYAVDLRGHNLSSTLDLGSSSTSVALTSGVDIVEFQKRVVINNAMLIGVNFGAMVACHAALSSPESFSGLTLFVNDVAQIMRFVPSSYPLRSLLKTLPTNFQSITALNEYLKERIPNHTERMILLSTCERNEAGVSLRYNKALFDLEKEISFGTFDNDVTFDKPVRVYVRSSTGNNTSSESTFSKTNKCDGNDKMNNTNKDSEELFLPREFTQHFPHNAIKYVNSEDWNKYMRLAPIPSVATSRESLQEVQQFLCEEEQFNEIERAVSELKAI